MKLYYIVIVTALLVFGFFLFNAISIKENLVNNAFAPKKPKISFAAWGNPNDREIFKQVTKEFSQQNGALVDVFCFSDKESLRNKVITQFAAGEPFDVFYADEVAFEILAQKDWLIDLSDLQSSGQFKSNEFNTTAYKKGLFGTKLLGLPASVNPYVIYYNVRLFREASLRSPEEYYKSGSWNQEQMGIVFKKLKEQTKAYGMSIRNDWQTLFSIIYNNGGKIQGVLDDGSFELDNTAAESVRFFKEMIGHEYCVYMGNLPKGVTEEEMFKSEQVAMVYGGFEYTYILKEMKGLEWDIIPFPSQGQMCRISALDIPIISAARNTGEDKLVKDFLIFYTGFYGQKLRLEKGERCLTSMKYPFYMSSGQILLPKHVNYYFSSLYDGFAEDNTFNYLMNKNEIFTKLNKYWSGENSIETIVKD